MKRNFESQMSAISKVGGVTNKLGDDGYDES